MRRRKLLTLLASVAALRPLAAAAQRQKAMPVIGFLGGFNPSMNAEIELELAAFREGLGEIGYVEWQNVLVEYTRRAEGHLDRLPALAADLVRRNVDVIVTQGGDPALFAAKAATSTIPIVFHSSSDPVAAGMVSSLARPGGNLTGVSMLSVDLMPKLLELLLELVPQAKVIALLVRPDSPDTERIIGAVQTAVRTRPVEIINLRVRVKSELDGAFSTLRRMHSDGLMLPQFAFRAEIARIGIGPRGSRNRPTARFRQGRWTSQLRPEHSSHLPSQGHLRRKDPEGRQARRPAGTAADQIRAGHQPEDRQGAEPYRAAIAPRPGRRGHRIRRGAPALLPIAKSGNIDTSQRY
jgi:ABC-type uncharacterized transport system substrate-binding protein